MTRPPTPETFAAPETEAEGSLPGEEGTLQRWWTTRSERRGMAVLLILSLLIFGPLLIHIVYSTGTDYIAHLNFALDMLNNGHFETTHILFQILVIVLIKLTPMSLQAAGVVVALTTYLVTTLVLYALIRSATIGRAGSITAAIVLSLALLLVTPVTALTSFSHNMYFGYVGINVYHNPTSLVIKPFALLLFAFTLSILNGTIRLEVRSLTFSTMLIFLSVIAKPSFVTVLLPALLVLGAYCLLRRDTTRLKAILIMLVLPMLVLLGVQYLYTYTLNVDDVRVVFAPLESVGLFEPSIGGIAVKFVLSIAFPLVVYLTHLRQAARHQALNLAWLVFLAGAAQMYLFNETGERRVHGNFWWSAQIGLFVLFTISAIFWLKRFSQEPRWRGWLCLAIFTLHAYGGLLYYLAHFVIDKMWEPW